MNSQFNNRIKFYLGTSSSIIPHLAQNGNKYDFTCINDTTISLSAKTSKKDGKVCPQVIGQPSRKNFCEFTNFVISHA